MTNRWILIVSLFFIFAHFFLALLIPSFIAPESFPYHDDLVKSGLPQYIYSFANFDGAQYLKIAQNGYLPLTQAFFPLYPISIRIAFIVTSIPHLLSGLLISLLSFIGVCILLNKYLQNLSFTNKEIKWFFFFFLAFPTSFFLVSLYTESIFFLLFLGGLVSLQYKKLVIAGICGLAIGLTRVTGIFLIIPMFAQLLQIHLDQPSTLSPVQGILEVLKKRKNIMVLVAPLVGIILYLIFLKLTTGDYFAFFNLQKVSNATRSTDLVLLPQVLYRYIKIFMTATPNFQYFVAAVEFITLIFIGALIFYDVLKIIKSSKKKQFSLIGLHIYSISVLILPTLTGTLSSLPRYALPLLSTYLILAKVKNTHVKIAVVSIFLILHLILFSFFIQGYFVS